jgi:hypothetical protein
MQMAMQLYQAKQQTSSHVLRHYWQLNANGKANCWLMFHVALAPLIHGG